MKVYHLCSNHNVSWVQSSKFEDPGLPEILTSTRLGGICGNVLHCCAKTLLASACFNRPSATPLLEPRTDAADDNREQVVMSNMGQGREFSRTVHHRMTAIVRRVGPIGVSGLAGTLAVLLLLLVPSVAGAQYPERRGALSVLSGDLRPGSAATLEGSGFSPGVQVSLDVYSDPVHLMTTSADAAGEITLSVTLPKNLPPGKHELRATGAAPDGGTVVLSVPFEVSGPSLPRTGVSVWVAITTGFALLAAGTVLLMVARRRTVRGRRGHG